MASAIPFIIYENNKFAVSNEAKAYLSTINAPVAPICVMGKYRTGKSYLVNRLLGKKKTGFQVGNTIEACTHGIWLWPEPVILEINNENVYALVLDCEGAFYYILLDMPEILNNINLIIMENDYTNISHKEYVDEVLRGKNFYRDYVEEGGWGPCQANFFEVWKR